MAKLLGERVFVYYDWTRKCWSLKSMTTGKVLNYYANDDGTRTKDRIEAVALADCVFKVSAAGRQRVLDTGRKGVHAGVIGTLILLTNEVEAAATKSVRYNPVKFSTFVDGDTLAPVTSAPFAVLRDGKVKVPLT